MSNTTNYRLAVAKAAEALKNAEDYGLRHDNPYVRNCLEVAAIWAQLARAAAEHD